MNCLRLIEGLYYVFEKDDIIINYIGKFEDHKLIPITDIIKIYSEDDPILMMNKQKVSYLIIEAFQNVIRYSKTKKNNDFFSFRKIEENYFITTQNKIDNESLFELKNRIDNLNLKTQEELKEIYRYTLTNNEFSNQGGAGLGFIEMLRKSKQKIEYFFEKNCDNEISFYFKIKNSSYNASIKFERDIYHFYLANNIIFLIKYKYDIELREVLARLCSIIINEKKYIVYHIIVEIIQYLNFSDKITDQIIILQELQNSYSITVLNKIPSEAIKDFLIFISEINKLSKEQLKQLYFELIKKDDSNDTIFSFIEIIRRTTNFTYFYTSDFIILNFIIE